MKVKYFLSTKRYKVCSESKNQFAEINSRVVHLSGPYCKYGPPWEPIRILPYRKVRQRMLSCFLNLDLKALQVPVVWITESPFDCPFPDIFQTRLNDLGDFNLYPVCKIFSWSTKNIECTFSGSILESTKSDFWIKFGNYRQIFSDFVLDARVSAPSN